MRRPTGILLAVVVLGTILILPRLGLQSLWLDEGLTVRPAIEATSVADLVERVRALDTQPPGSHAVLYALRAALPQTEFFLRLPSFVAIEAGIVLLYILVARLWGSTTALLAAGLTQLSPFLAFFAAEVRNYGLWFLVVTASLLAMLRWYEAASVRDAPAGASAARWRWLIIWGVVNGIGLWIHLFHLFLIVGELAMILAIVIWPPEAGRRSLALLFSALLAQLIAVALFAPWFVVLAQTVATGEGGVGWTRAFSWANIPYYLFVLHFGFSLGPNLQELHVKSLGTLLAEHPVALSAAAAGLAIFAITYGLLVREALRRDERRWELLVLLVLPLAGLLGPFAYAIFKHFPLHPRHLIFVWPLVPLVTALGFLRVRWLRPAIAAVVAVQLMALGNLLLDPYYWKDDERGAIAFAEASSDANAYVLGDVAFFYATHGKGREKHFLEFGPNTKDVWFIDNRQWEASTPRERLPQRLSELGFTELEPNNQFRGIVLRHWKANGS